MYRVKRIVDISMPLTEDSPIYPGDPPPRITHIATLKKEGYNLHQLKITTHTGTHVDAPSHQLAGGLPLGKLDLNLFAAEGVVIPVVGKRPGEAITPVDLTSSGKIIPPQQAVLLHTGWHKKAGSNEYYRHPFLSPEACRYLLNLGVRTFGIDMLSVDSPVSTTFPVHRMIAAQGGVIIENLANLEQITFPHPLIVCLPLPLKNADGSPVRAVAIELRRGWRG